MIISQASGRPIWQERSGEIREGERAEAGTLWERSYNNVK